MARRSRIGVLVVAAVVSVVFASVTYLVTLRAQSSALAQHDADLAATVAAAEALPAIYGFGHATRTADLGDATALMTEDLAAQFVATAPQASADVGRDELDVVATVRAVAALECADACSTHRVRLLAFLDQARTVHGEPEDPVELSIEMTMVEADGTWLVADLSAR